jgi:sugar/nucleoside kinase (ribokinase family)/D-arabinose 5-phosphate isomerase GutQ
MLSRTRRYLGPGSRVFSSTSSALCVGAGSNVVDIFFPVRALPAPGDKAYFANEGLISGQVVGGVTLNHLAWARTLGVPTALMALQGTDANGVTIRSALQDMGMTTALVRASKEYTTSVSYILSEAGGERTILMNPASTSRMTGEVMAREWAASVSGARMVSTEISQLPLSGVEWLLRAARAAGAPSVLDVDVPPSVACGAAQLGTPEQLGRCVRGADVVKLTGGAVEELLQLLSPGVRPEPSLEGVCQQLADLLGCKLAVITDGSKGSALAVSRAAGGAGVAVRVPCFPGVTQVDATGAGDAFLGGLMAALWHSPTSSSPTTSSSGTFPTRDAQLMRVGRIASAAGAACVEVVGALPVAGVSAARLAALCADTLPLLSAAQALTAGGATAAPRAGSGASAGPTPASTAAALAFQNSLAADAATLASLSSPHSPIPPTTIAAVVAALGACRASPTKSLTPTPSSPPSPPSTLWTTGVGKAGAVAARAAISLKSLGYRACFTAAGEWAHGDLGGVSQGDVVLAFSHSGRTGEVMGVVGELVGRRGATLIAVTGDAASPLAAAASHVLVAGVGGGEGELLGAVPTRSVVAQEALVNALLAACVQAEGVTHSAFKANHPGGAIGGSRQ